MNQALEEIKTIIEKERQKGYINGILEGIRSAKNIALWYQANHKLRHPETAETLKEWTDNEINKLKELIKE